MLHMNDPRTSELHQRDATPSLRQEKLFVIGIHRYRVFGRCGQRIGGKDGINCREFGNVPFRMPSLQVEEEHDLVACRGGIKFFEIMH